LLLYSDCNQIHIKMKATVQYNDYVGSTAADISDFTTLEKYLEEIDVDIKRYHPIGVKFFTSYGDGCNVSILCEDMVNDNSLVELRLDEMSIPDFFSLFKRLEVILHLKSSGDRDITQSITINIDPIKKEKLIQFGFSEDGDIYTKKYANGIIATLYNEGEGVIPHADFKDKDYPYSIVYKMSDIEQLDNNWNKGNLNF